MTDSFNWVLRMSVLTSAERCYVQHYQTKDNEDASEVRRQQAEVMNKLAESGDLEAMLSTERVFLVHDHESPDDPETKMPSLSTAIEEIDAALAEVRQLTLKAAKK